jgi:hypothetical protein
MTRIANTAIRLALILGVFGIPLAAQNQTSSPSQSTAPESASSGGSLGAYARQVRKDPGTGTKPKVFDNDNLPKEDKLSIVGQETPADSTAEAKPGEAPNAAGAKPASDSKVSPDDKPASDGGTTSKTPAETKPGTGDKGADKAANKTSPEQAQQEMWKEWGNKISSQQQQIDLISRELDVLQREYKLRAAEMYADVGNRLRNSADWDKQDAQYKQQIADKQQALDDAKQKLDDLQEDARKAGVPSSVREP